jgi:5'-methylthioadenosine phosphorylase
MTTATLGVIGGSGIYDIEDFTLLEEIELDTPFGKPSDPVRIGSFGGGVNIAFISRHGKGHRLLPAEVPSRANIWALKSLGVTTVISLSAVGSLRNSSSLPHLRPGPDVDKTHGRPATFFGNGIVGHVSVATPLRTHPAEADPGRQGLRRYRPRGRHLRLHGGALLLHPCGEQPAPQLGAAVIGMTALPEAKLAREAELCYATLALVTDYDCWHEEEEDVSVGMVVETMRKNTLLAKQVLRRFAEDTTSAAAAPAARRPAML